MHYYLEKRVSHKAWRSLVKKERRRKKRQKLAQMKDEKTKLEMALLLSDPAYQSWIEEQELLEEEARRLENLVAKKRREEWMAWDLALHKVWLENRDKKMALVAEKKAQEERIKIEWQESVNREKAEQQKKTEAQEALLKKATCGLGGQQKEATHNPLPPPGLSRLYSEQKVEPCPFFNKTGACRFGAKCSREHDYPVSSRTLLLPNMYTHFGFDGSAGDDYDMDIGLEYSESDRYNHFRDFFFDVLCEFKKCGRVVQFKVCCNRSPHLRGNVYVEYEKVEAAETALGMFNGRWYAGKQITCIFVPVHKWKPAICGLYWSQKCPKGDNCNFLHVFRNPGNAFHRADKDQHSNSRNQDASNGGSSSRRTSSRRSHRKSRSRSKEGHSSRRSRRGDSSSRSSTRRNSSRRDSSRDRNYRRPKRRKSSERHRSPSRGRTKTRRRSSRSVSRERGNITKGEKR